MPISSQSLLVDEAENEGNFMMAMKTDSTATRAHDTQEQYFRVTDQISGTVWYWSAVTSILASALLFLTGKRDWSMFVGQWPPTFLLFGLYHKLIGGQR